jgi:hypothetical protein
VQGEDPLEQPRRRHRNSRAASTASVEIDLDRPVKSFDAILNAVVMELLRTGSAKVKLKLEIEAETPAGFSQADISVVRDNAQQLKFNTNSTKFE